jgi:hypothetical protein
MYKFKLFSEWREKELIGESFVDALTRQKKLQRSDKFIPGLRYPENKIEGDYLEIKRVIGLKDLNDGVRRSRGDKPYIVAIVEFTNDMIEEVDACPEKLNIIQ